MAEITKFNERNITLLGVIEATAGTYTAPASTNAILGTTLTGAITYETGANKYLGDNLSRLEYTYLKDVYADISVDTFQQVQGALSTTLGGSAIISNFPLSQFYQACGGHTTAITGSSWNGYPVGALIVDNVNSSPSTLSVDLRQRSIQDTINEKLWRFLYVRGTVDITASLGEVPTVKFNLKGNAVPTAIAALIAPPSYGTQSSMVAATIRKQNISLASIYPSIPVSTLAFVTTTAYAFAPAHGLSTGDSIMMTGVRINGVTTDDTYYNGTFSVTVLDINNFTYTMTGTPTANALGNPVALVMTPSKVKTFNFSKLTAANFFGFSLTRYLSALEEGFDIDGTPTDVSISALAIQTPNVQATSITFVGTTGTVTLPIVHGLAAGDIVSISGSYANVYNNPAAVVLAGGLTSTAFTYTLGGTPGANALADSNGALRVLCVNSANFNSAAPGTLVNLSAQFDPDSNITGFFGVRLIVGTVLGKTVMIMWNRLQLTSVKDDKVANLLARDMTFRNTGNSTLGFM